MAHAHDEDKGTYFLDQLCAIAMSGGIAVICIAVYFWQRGILYLLLAEGFHFYVMLAGVALLALVAMRAMALWRETGASGQVNGNGHNHSHEPGQACCHDHGHDHNHDHAHGHAHDHTHGP